MCVRACVCVCACVRVCVYAYVQECMHVSIIMCVPACISRYVRVGMYIVHVWKNAVVSRIMPSCENRASIAPFHVVYAAVSRLLPAEYHT